MTATWNAKTGDLGPVTLAAEVPSPTFLAKFRRAGGDTFLYSISEASGPKAKVTAFHVEHSTGHLTLLNSVPTGGDGPAHVSLSPDGQTVLAANYGGGSVTSFRVQGDGSLSAAVSHFQYTGSGPNHARQDKPHTHSAVTSRDGRFVVVNDLGLDRIFLYHLDPSTARLTPCDPPFWSGRPGSGPRHIAWNSDGKYLYSANELDSTIDVLAWTSKAPGLRAVQTVSSLPPGFPEGKAFVGEIVASADGRNIYAGNRVADDTVATFDIKPADGTLTAARLAPSGGKNCRHIALDPTDRWMVISHQSSNDLTVLQRDPANGNLSEPKHTYPVNKPMCVVFV